MASVNDMDVLVNLMWWLVRICDIISWLLSDSLSELSWSDLVLFCCVGRKMITGIWTSSLLTLPLISSMSRCGPVTACTWKLSTNSTSGLCQHLWQPHVSFWYCFVTEMCRSVYQNCHWMTSVISSDYCGYPDVWFVLNTVHVNYQVYIIISVFAFV